MLEPILFILFIVVAVAVMYILKTILCSLSPAFKRFMGKLEAVPEDEAKMHCHHKEKRKPISAPTDTGENRSQKPSKSHIYSTTGFETPQVKRRKLP